MSAIYAELKSIIVFAYVRILQERPIHPWLHRQTLGSMHRP